jgi:hypothetical protein
MRLHRSPLLLSVLLLLPAFPLPARAIPAIQCHCFTERSYDPARPTIADPYFLAAGQNSFMAAAYGLEKRSIVLQKQQGTSGDDLWIAHWAAAASGTPAETLLKKKGSWKDTIAPLKISPQALGPKVKTTLALRNPTDGKLAEAVVDDLLLRHRLVPEKELTALRKGRAGSQEVILSMLLAAKTQKPASQIHQQVREKGASWGELLLRAGIEASGMQEEFAQMMKKGK